MKRGNITKSKKKNGETVYKIQFMYKNVRYKKTFSTKKACEQWEREVKSQIDNVGFYNQCNKTLKEIINDWWHLDSNTLAPNTQNYYKAAIKKINKYSISEITINHISFSDLQAFFNQLAEDGNNKGSCTNVKKVLSHAFKLAVTNQYIQFNPLVYVKNKGKETKDPNAKMILTLDEYNKISNYFKESKSFKDNSIYIMIQIANFTGARISEAIAVEWDDVDFIHNTITLDKKYEVTEKVATTRMKTKASKATLPLAQPLKEILLDWKGKNSHTLICCQENGSYITPVMIHTAFNKMKNDIGIYFHFHMLRHGFGSRLVAQGVNIKVVQKLMRHAQITTTMDVYVHADEQAERDAIEQVFSESTPKLPQSTNA